MSTTVSAKIPRLLKEKLQRYGIVVSRVIRRALEVEVARVEKDERCKELGTVARRLKGKISVEDVVKAVRRAREER